MNAEEVQKFLRDEYAREEEKIVLGGGDSEDPDSEEDEDEDSENDDKFDEDDAKYDEAEREMIVRSILSLATALDPKLKAESLVSMSFSDLEKVHKKLRKKMVKQKQ